MQHIAAWLERTTRQALTRLRLAGARPSFRLRRDRLVHQCYANATELMAENRKQRHSKVVACTLRVSPGGCTESQMCATGLCLLNNCQVGPNLSFLPCILKS